MPELFLFTGFLGSGKTTLLQNLLRWTGDLSRTGILVNEYGTMGIDGEILRGTAVPVVELANGCICCTMRHALARSIKELQARYHLDRLLVEATGVADPWEILASLARDLSLPEEGLRVVTVLSADLWECREVLGPLFHNQVTAADLLLLNKIDLVSRPSMDRSLEEIREINPSCLLQATTSCRLEPEVLWRLPGRSSHPAHPQAQASIGNRRTDPAGAGFQSFVFIHEAPFRRKRLERLIETLPAGLYRIKGFARLEEGCFLYSYSNGQSDWLPLEQPGPTRLTLIGRNVDEESIAAGLESCLVAA